MGVYCVVKNNIFASWLIVIITGTVVNPFQVKVL